MKCQNCNAEIQNHAKFCPKCGTKVEVSPQPAKSKFPHDISGVWPEWELVKQLGRGSFGVVYQAVRRDNNVESHAAIKIITIPADMSEIDSLRADGVDVDGTRTYFKGIVDEFVGEIQLMETLKGVQNIVSVEDYKVIEKKDTIGWDIYIRMELLTPFNNYACDKDLTEKDIVKLGIDICSALEICEQRKIIHRDIKPENIFINSFGHFKLGDFGIARKLENMTGGLSQKGTYNYMAPEVAKSSQYDGSVDIYSLGIVLYKLMNRNRLPFLESEKQLLNPHDRKTAVERRISGEELPRPVDASDEMADIILRACSPDAETRFASAKAMKTALESLTKGTYEVAGSDLDKTTSVRPAEKSEAANGHSGEPAVDTFGKKKKSKKGKKGKVIVITVLALIVAIAVALAIFFFRSSAYSVYTNITDDEIAVAIEDYRSGVKDNFIEETLLGFLLKDPVPHVTSEYENGNVDYEGAAEELRALDEMGYEGAMEKLTEIMSTYANSVAADYENGTLTYESALALLESLKADGCVEADALIEKITAMNDAANALEKADEYYESGDYESAISEYSKVPETDQNYEEAQAKLSEVYKNYIASVVASAEGYNAAGEYKQAVQQVNTAYEILPSTVDTSALDAVKEESYASYKTQVANDVAELTEEVKWAEAFKLIDEAIVFDNNEYFQSLKTSTQKSYVDSVTATVQSHLDKEDYISAKRVAENSLTVLPDNADLKKLVKEVENKTPIYLLDVCEPYDKFNFTQYVNGETFNMSGKSYTNGFTLSGTSSSAYNEYAIFNIDKQYTTLSFWTGHVDGSEKHGVVIKVYCDGVLKEEIPMGSEDLPVKIEIDITGVEQLKILTSDLIRATYGFANVTVE